MITIDKERAVLRAAPVKPPVQTEPARSAFEKELMKIMKQSNYSNVSQIYKNFYKESKNPEDVQKIIS